MSNKENNENFNEELLEFKEEIDAPEAKTQQEQQSADEREALLKQYEADGDEDKIEPEAEEKNNPEQKPGSEDNKKKKKKGAGRLSSRAFKKGGAATLITCLFLAAIVIINVICNILVDKFNVLSFDLSTNSVNQLSEDTLDLLSGLEQDVKITVLAKENDYISANTYFSQANSLVHQYEKRSDKISIEYIDLSENPTFTTKYPDDTLYAGNYIVSCGDKYRVLTDNELFNLTYDQTTGEQTVESLNVEPAVTTAILNVTSAEQTKIAFLEGFGDYDASALKSLLKQNNYDVSEVTLITEDIEADTAAVVIFSPTVDLSSETAQKINAFLNNNGKYGKTLMYIPASTAKTDCPILDSLLEEWGMAFEQGVVSETDSSYLVTNSGISILDYQNEDYTAGLKNSTIPVVQVYSQPISILDDSNVKSLLSTSESAALIPYDADENFSIDNAEKKQYCTAAISTKSGNEADSNIVAVASPYMFYDEFLSASSFNNAEYFINVLNILTDKEDVGVTIAPKNLTNQELGIVAAQYNGLGILFAVVLPIIILGVGVVVWLLRRNK